jgi:alkanesulfonate monooxygenase SsuD/methylene tetrahydromethanopterin reductase-like flavin-dependent oxidoreductase (luciferase family)
VPRQRDADAQRRAEHARLLDEVTVAEAGDRAGFKYSWFTEHHFLEEYSHGAPSASTSAPASSTSRHR